MNNQKPKTPADVRSLARSHSEMAIRVLAAIAKQEKCPPAARCMAAQALLDRGWGKPAQAITGEDGGELKITIRQLVDSATTNIKSDGEPSGESREHKACCANSLN